MSTVVDIMRAFLDKYKDKIQVLEFSAKEDSRQGLYARMVKRLLPNWTMTQKDGFFTLFAPKQDVAETWGVEKYPIPLPIGQYLAVGSDEFAPPGNYASADDLVDDVYDLIDAGVEPQVVAVDPKTLLATQDWLSNEGGSEPLFDEYPDKPVIYKKAGKLYILDGHHRTTRAWKAGRPISVYLFGDDQQNELGESVGSDYKEIEFICVNPQFPDATDPELQKQMFVELKKIPGVIPLWQEWGDYSEGQLSLSAIYKDKAARSKILSLAKQLGVKIDLEQSVNDGYVDRAVRGEHEGQITENFADGKNPGRKGLAKRMGVNTKASVSSLRKTAKNSSGEKQRMAHWLANMKAGRAK
jgi:hypothetical protein